MNNELLGKLKPDESSSVEIISFVGGGGKTTNIESLSMALKSQGKRVLSTTSTAILIPSNKFYDEIFIGNMPAAYKPPNGSITVYGDYIKMDKLRAKNTLVIDEIIGRNLFDYVLIEADGSQEKPIKAPADHEPVISKYTSLTVGVIGMDSLGKQVGKIAHRPEILAGIINKGETGIIECDDIVKLASHKDGIFKSSKGKKILLLNKVKDEQFEKVKKIKNALLSSDIDIIVGKWQ